MWVEGANPNTPKTPSSHSWGRFLFFSAHISQIMQKVIKGYDDILLYYRMAFDVLLFVLQEAFLIHFYVYFHKNKKKI
jgi:hypothetical protein